MQETSRHISVRRGHTDEATALAKLHVDVWRATYRDYAPKAAFELLDEETRRPYWDSALAITEPGRGVWISMGAESILGVVSIGMSDHPAFESRAEIEHLYVSLRAQGHGIGKRLLHTAIDESNKAGVRGVGLAVVRQNERAREFYRKMGGVELGSFIDPGPLWRSDNILMAWDFA